MISQTENPVTIPFKVTSPLGEISTHRLIFDCFPSWGAAARSPLQSMDVNSFFEPFTLSRSILVDKAAEDAVVLDVTTEAGVHYRKP